MKIFVVSDTHQSFNFAPFLEIVAREKPDAIFHCGDGTRDRNDLHALGLCPVYDVAGNCDLLGPLIRTEEIGSHRILCTHGHLYNARNSVDMLKEKAKETGADVVLYGHTHIPEITHADGILIMNPGSLCRPKDGLDATFGVLNITNETIYPEIRVYQGG